MHTLKILLVEDDQDDVELMEDALRDKGLDFAMTVIKQGDKVLPALKESSDHPHLILLDLNIPKMHGRDVLARLKADRNLRHIPIVILTTSSSQSERDYCIDAGATQFLTKPSTVEGFEETIKTIFEIALQHQA